MAYLIAKAGAGIARGELLGRIFVLRGGGGRHVTRRGTPWARWAPVGPGGPRWAPVGPVAPVAGDFGAIFLG